MATSETSLIEEVVRYAQTSGSQAINRDHFESEQDLFEVFAPREPQQELSQEARAFIQTVRTRFSSRVDPGNLERVLRQLPPTFAPGEDVYV